ncbi:MAG: proline dehydrogenase [FCB group bacterium]|nr:proline dehydrogenase [FCB group bacterium]
MKGLNTVVAGTLSYLPKWFARPFANPYVAGESFSEAAQVVRGLNHRGFKATLDILGEHVTSIEEAHAVRDAYAMLFRDIEAEKLDTGVSLKLTHLGLALDRALVEENVLALGDAAKKTGNFLRIDMENSPYTTATLDIFQRCLGRYNRVGTVLQAYLRRTLDDIEALGSPNLNVRICKGIYREPVEIAFQDPEKIRENYFAAVQAVIQSGGFVAVATHDLSLITQVETWFENASIPPDRFEFQVLYGVPMQGKLEALRDKGFTVRIYVPFGAAWFDYSIRRLQENPHILGYVLKNMFTSRT